MPKFKLLSTAFLFVSFVLAIPLHAQERPVATAQQAPSSNVNVLSRLRSTVGFLRVGYFDNGEQKRIEGTCFFVFYEDKRLGDNRGFVYLVTNRHMAIPGIDKGTPHSPSWVTLRLNLRNPVNGKQFEEARIPETDSNKWYFPQDESIDLAVMSLVPDQNKYDIAWISTNLFATKQKVASTGISEGDSVWFTGYFYSVPGQIRIQPIVRQGILAMMPNEPLDTVLGKPGNIYLTDLHTIKGNSGSPCFVAVGGLRNGALSLVESFPYRLLGIVSGYYVEDSDFQLRVAATVDGRIEGNSGVSMIVPSDELQSLLDSPALQKARDDFVAKASSGH